MFCASPCKKFAARKIYDLKRAYFRVDFCAEEAVRLSPYNNKRKQGGKRRQVKPRQFRVLSHYAPIRLYFSFSITLIFYRQCYLRDEILFLAVLGGTFKINMTAHAL